MNIKAFNLNLPKMYSRIVAETKEGFVLSRPNEIAKSMEVAFVDKQFSILHEVQLKEYERGKYNLVINPNNTSIFGYFKLDSALTFYTNKEEKQHQFDIKCAAAGFDNNNNLFVAERIDEEHLSISIFDEKLELLDTLEIIDPLYESFVDFEFNPLLNRMFLSLAGGQDGCAYYTIDINGSKIIFGEFVNDIAIIETNENKDHFLTIDSYACLINFYAYPDLELISSFDYFEYFDEGEINFSLVYLEKNIYIIFYNGIPYMYDAIKGKIIRELKIENHLPKPIKEFYPTLADEDLMTDIIGAKRFGSIIAFETLNGLSFYIEVADIII